MCAVAGKAKAFFSVEWVAHMSGLHIYTSLVSYCDHRTHVDGCCSEASLRTRVSCITREAICARVVR